MGATTQFRNGSTLTTAILAAATSISVANAGATGLNWSQGDSVRIIGIQDIVNGAQPAPLVSDLVDAAPQDGILTGNSIAGFDAPGAANAAGIGSVAANLTTAALVENTDYVIDYEGGKYRFINPALTAGQNFALLYQYRRFDNTKVLLGESLPTIEARVRLVHQFPDQRELTVVFHRASVSMDSASLEFQDDDWIGTELTLDALQTLNPQDIGKFGYYEIQHKEDGNNSEGYDPDSYSVGTFQMYLTILSPTVAAKRGLPLTEIDVGNVSVGSVNAENTYLKHYRGIPRTTDKVVLTQKELNCSATLENLNTVNIALLFDGVQVQDQTGATWQDAGLLATIPNDLATAEGIARWYNIPAINLNPA